MSSYLEKDLVDILEGERAWNIKFFRSRAGANVWWRHHCFWWVCFYYHTVEEEVRKEVEMRRSSEWLGED